MLRDVGDGVVDRSIVDDKHLDVDARHGFLHAIETLRHEMTHIITDYDNS